MLWRGDTKVAGVDVVKCWSDGQQKAMSYLMALQIFNDDELDIDKILKEEPGVDMLRPYCRSTSVGVLSGDRAVYDLAGANPNDDEYAEVDVLSGEE